MREREQALERARLSIQQGVSDYLSKKRAREIAVKLKEQALERTRHNIQQSVPEFIAVKEVKDAKTTVVSKKDEQESRFKSFEGKLRQRLNKSIDEDPKLRTNIERLRELSKSTDEDWGIMSVLRVVSTLIFYLISLPLLSLLPLSVSIPLIFVYTYVMYKKYR